MCTHFSLRFSVISAVFYCVISINGEGKRAGVVIDFDSIVLHDSQGL